jgi:hypothetical protein
MNQNKKITLQNPDHPFNELPLLPPPPEKIETVNVLRQLVKSSVALAELKDITHTFLTRIFC